MKKLIVLAVASLVATSANAAEMKWSGSAGWRYNQTSLDDNLGSTSIATATNGKDTSTQKTKAHQIRANIGAMGGWDNIEWGVSVRTNNGVANDDHINLLNNTDRTIGLEQAWFRYLRDFGSLDFSLTVGRQKNVLAYDNEWQNLFDNDVRWDGFGWQFKFGMFGLNAAQYILGARSAGTNGTSSISYTQAQEGAMTTQSKFYVLYAVQPYMNWKFSDDIETNLAVGYYSWSDEASTNTTGGGYNAASWNTGTVTKAALASGSYRIHNSRQWHFLNTWSLPYKLALNLEYVMNKDAKYTTASMSTYTFGSRTKDVSRNMFTGGLKYGSLRKAQDFTISYAFGSKGIGSVINAYANEGFAADNKGHIIGVGYAVADNFHLNWAGYFLKEKERVSAVDGRPYSEVNPNNANQGLRTKYWELTAGVMF